VSWNQIVVLGVCVTLAAFGLARGVKSANEASLQRRYRWVIRLTLGFSGVLLLGVLVPLGRFVWTLKDSEVTPEQRALLLEPCIAAGFNLVFGFLVFGTLLTGVAFMIARRLHPEE
jgi:hypothetical protein